MSERRWKLGNYTVKYNPKSDSTSYTSNQTETTTASGKVSSNNTTFSGNKSFSIDLYDKPTYIERSPMFTLGSSLNYISITEDRFNDIIYVLDDQGSISSYRLNGMPNGNISITFADSYVPTSKPISIAYMSSKIAIWYEEGMLAISDQNGVVNNHYSFSDADLIAAKSMAWDFNETVFLLNKFGKIFTIDTTTGSESFLLSFTDFSSNQTSNLEFYQSIEIYQRDTRYFIGILDANNQITYYNETTLEAVGRNTLDNTSIIDISFDNYSLKNVLLVGNEIYEFHPNTCRLDLDVIKNLASSGQVVIYDEAGVPMVIFIASISIERQRNYNEDMYSISFSGEIAYQNQGFGNTFINFVNGG